MPLRQSICADGLNNKDPFILDDLLCYCFGYSRDDIRKDVSKNGRSTILERIKSEKRLGNCQCARNHPLGR